VKPRILFSVCLCLLIAVVVTGCGVKQGMSVEDAEKEAAIRAAYLDMFATVAEKHGLAYSIHARFGGKPSVSQELKFALDSDITIDVTMHGNSAAERPPID